MESNVTATVSDSQETIFVALSFVLSMLVNIGFAAAVFGWLQLDKVTWPTMMPDDCCDVCTFFCYRQCGECCRKWKMDRERMQAELEQRELEEARALELWKTEKKRENERNERKQRLEQQLLDAEEEQRHREEERALVEKLNKTKGWTEFKEK